MNQRFANLESFILDKMIETKLPGLSMALIEKDMLKCCTFGFKDLTTRTPPSSETLFGIGSITKVFTAIAILQLQEKAALNLDDPVSNYVDINEFLGEPILIKHLLSHSSGLPALGFSESKMSERWWMDGYPISSLEDVLRFMQGAADWMHTKPGECWFYLNEGYILLGAIIERITGQPYRDYIHEQVLTPLGMKRSWFKRDKIEPDADRATPYMQGRDGSLFSGTNLYSELPAAGGLVSTASDMAKLAQMFLRQGRLENGEPFLNKASFELMSTPFVPLPAEPLSEQQEMQMQKSFNGLGLLCHQGFFEYTILGHGGGVMGGTSYLAFIPEQQIAVVLLANAHGYPMLQLAVAALASLLNEDIKGLPFVRFEKILNALEGHYTSFKNTIQATVKRYAGGLELRLCFKHEDRVIVLFPMSISEDISRFKAFSGGRQTEVNFIGSPDKLELIYERYKFRKN